ncbi:MAG: hypothetical protein P794_04955, partial [Epsilonproteobacteria bacterium (ex Lamellibrachia satsuma)]
HIQIELEKKLLLTLEKNRKLINAHLHWMQTFIANIKGEKKPLELDPHYCEIGKWLLAYKGDSDYEEIDKKHKCLHALAQSAIRMHEKREYAYFLLPYHEILTYSYNIRDMLMNFYMVEHLDSIYIDPLTGLSNYLQLLEYIESCNKEMSLFIFNISEFSKINLVYGHKKSNKILKEIANYLLEEVGAESVFRIYADEFAVVIDTKDRKSIASKMKIEIENHLYTVSENKITLRIYGCVASFGEQVLELCEYGMMASKEQHGSIIESEKIDKDQIEYFANNITFQQKLRLAFMDSRILLYFQPILDLRSNKIIKYEVLMRIKDEHGEILLPSDFLDILKKMYIYPEVTKLIIKKAFEFFKDKPYKFSINLSYLDIIDTEIKIFISTILKNNSETAKRCIFELLESEAALNLQEVNDFFVMVHSYGAKIAIDDFGSGYSNYDVIFNFDIDYIKIDGILVQNLENDHKSQIMVESIVSLAKETGSKVIAEWISNKTLLEKVRVMGIDYAQGYYIGKPSPALMPNKK